MADFTLHDILRTTVVKGLDELYQAKVGIEYIQIGPTRKEFEGEQTLLVFPLVRYVKKNPEQLANELGAYLKSNLDFVEDFNAVKGFLNLVFSDNYWHAMLAWMNREPHFGFKSPSGKKVLIEYSSPNTNKPLHLGHIRNILLGSAMVRLLQSQGHEVIRTQIINDRGIAICKSMLAWQKWGDGETPFTANPPMKGDHFVGKYYVLFDQAFKEEYKQWQSSEQAQALYKQSDAKDSDSFFGTYKNTYFNNYSPLGREATEMLQNWEKGDLKVRALWQTMNGWVLEGIEKTYQRLGASFEKNYYESEVYSIGKTMVRQGIEQGVFYTEKDGSVWANLEDVGMDKKIVLRSDGTSVYITQDLGTAHLRYEDFDTQRFVYVVADEQEYHFKVLFELLKRLKAPYAAGLHHLSYGMVELPDGKMKSREGTVVDADDLMNAVVSLAENESKDRGELQLLPEQERKALYEMIGLGALKYYILKVNAKKKMVFNPEESVDLQGQTGPYIQNAFVRIKSLERKDSATSQPGNSKEYHSIKKEEKHLLTLLHDYPSILEESAVEYNPSGLAVYLYQLAKSFHRFYHEVRILSAETEEAKSFRLSLANRVASVLQSGMNILGVQMPDRM